MNAKRNSSILTAFGLVLAAALATAAHGEIVFVGLDDLPLGDQLIIQDGPFMAAFLHGPPCEELPPGIWGPPCIAVYCGWFADDDGNGSIDNLTAGARIGSQLDYFDSGVIAGFEVIDPTIDPNRWEWQPIDNEWFDPSGVPVRGYIAWGGNPTAGDPHYGWIELTVEYDTAANEFSAILHGYAYETQPNTVIHAGEGAPCLGDLNGDGVINLADLSQMLANYPTTGGASYQDGDLDGDGDVDLSDLSALLGVYDTACD